MRFKSCAQWPAGTFDSLGNYTEDEHDTRDQAEGVCEMLRQRGAGGDGLAFPLETWVVEMKPDSAKSGSPEMHRPPLVPGAAASESELAAEVFDPRVSDLAYFLQRRRRFGL